MGRSRLKQLTLNIALDQNATWDNWLSRARTESLESAIKTLGEGSMTSLYVCGLEGVGKSHLIQAYCHSFSGDMRFLSVGAVCKYPAHEVLVDLELSDLLAIDELQYLTGRQDWQEEMFHLLNRCQQRQTLLLFGSRQSPSGLPDWLPDLQSRLAAFGIFQIPTWNLDDARRLFIWRADKRGISVSAEVAYYCVSRLPRSGHSLISALDLIDQESLATGRPITIPLLKTMEIFSST